MSQVDPLETQLKLPSEAALDLLSKCRSTLCEFDNTGSYEEADLAHVAARIRKIAAVLVPGAHLSSVLLNIDDALQTSAEDRKVEKTLGTVFPGPFLLTRAKGLIRVADGLRDDFALGRLGPVSPEPPPDDDQGEPPPLAKWATWCWSNRRKRTGLVILLLLMAALWCLLTLYPRLSP